MKRLLFTLFLCCSCWTEAAEEGGIPHLNISLLSSGHLESLNDNTHNPNNLLQVASASSDLAAVMDVDLFNVIGRLRASSHLSNQPQEEESKLSVLSFYRDWWITPATKISLGRIPLNWDVSYSRKVLDFFSSSNSQMDYDDLYANIRGSNLINLTTIHHKSEVSFVFAENNLDPFFNDQEKNSQIAFMFRQTLDNFTVGTVVQQPLGMKPGMGLFVSHSNSADLEWHFATFARQGTSRPIHKDIYATSTQFYASDPTDPWRQKENAWYPRWNIGFNWTSENLINFIVEWIHDQRGLNNQQWRHFQQLVRFHHLGTMFGVPKTAIDGNLRYDASAFSVHGARQDYLFLHAEHRSDAFSLQLNSLLGLADRGISLNPRLIYSFSNTLQFWLDAQYNTGPDKSEFDLSPRRASLTLSLKKGF